MADHPDDLISELDSIKGLLDENIARSEQSSAPLLNIDEEPDPSAIRFDDPIPEEEEYEEPEEEDLDAMLSRVTADETPPVADTTQASDDEVDTIPVLNQVVDDAPAEYQHALQLDDDGIPILSEVIDESTEAAAPMPASTEGAALEDELAEEVTPPAPSLNKLMATAEAMLEQQWPRIKAQLKAELMEELKQKFGLND